MASLALLVAIMFVSVLLIGPLCYIISLFEWMPKLIIYPLSAVTICIGLWWLFLPVPNIRYMGLVPIYLGYLSIRNKNNVIVRNNNN
jgi:hypothetical protein